MRRFAVLIAATLGLAFSAAPAYANHANVQGEVDVFHGGNTVSTNFSRVACSTESCSVTVTVSKRTYRRFLRWCGSTMVTVTIPSGESTATEICSGPSTWLIAVSADLLDAAFNFDVTHPADVDVTITVTT